MDCNACDEYTKAQDGPTNAEIISMAWVTLELFLLLLIAALSPLRGETLNKYISSDHHGDVAAAEPDMIELPQPYAVPLPEECYVPGSHTRSYNQGQCSRSSCTTSHGPCAQSLHCCYEIEKTSSVEFLCSLSSTRLKALLILTCSCQVCEKLHTHIRGRVLSSLKRNPVVLAAIMIETEVATFTDEQGYFSFDLSTGNGDVVLQFQESQHRLLEVGVNIRHSKSPEINVVMEYIEATQLVERIHLGADLTLQSKEKSDDQISLKFAPHSLMSHSSMGSYEGPGQLMYSLFDSKERPDFTSEALSRMVYTDSKGAVFSIQSFVICSMELVGESGSELVLRPGYSVTVKLILKFNMNIVEADVNRMHLFVYSKAKSSWVDSGKVGIKSIHQQDKEYGSLVEIQQTLRELNSLWTVGLPVRVSCYVKAMVRNDQTKKELAQMTLSLTQSDTSLRRPTFYQYLSSGGGGGVCLKAVCSLGGIVRVLASASDKVTAIAPNVDVGMVMGDKQQITFYDTDKEWSSQTPFYHTEKECETATKHYLEFVSNHSTIPTSLQPSMLPLIKQGESVKSPQSSQKEYCFVKVSVYDCAPMTEVKVLSYSAANHQQLLSMNTAVAMGTDGDLNTCQTSEVVSLRASCVQFTCGSDVHVTVQSQNHYDTYSRTTDGTTSHIINCRYWSSNSNVDQELQHPSENMKSFHLLDSKELSPSYGVYRSVSASLALLQCMSGRVDAPGNGIDPETGVAVVFTCLI